ncbi:MAG: DUF5995 family protein [Ferruginibacter sp.]
MKLFVWILGLLFSYNFVSAQSNSNLLSASPGHQALCSLSNQSSISKHFAYIYVHNDSILDQQLATVDSEIVQLDIRFAHSFMQRFLAADSAFTKHQPLPVFWNTYFADTNRNAITYWMLGMNAHINGDLPVVFATHFTLKELKQHYKQFKSYNPSFDKQIIWGMQQAIVAQKKIRILHRLSLGLDRLFVQRTIHRWRKRAYKAAISMHEKGIVNYALLERRCRKTDKKIRAFSKRFIQSQ